jgi:hypothetical protein
MFNTFASKAMQANCRNNKAEPYELTASSFFLLILGNP